MFGLIKKVAEFLYFCSIIFIGVTAYIGKKHLDTIKTDMLIRNKRHAINTSVECLKRLADEVFPHIREFKKSVALEIPDYCDDDHFTMTNLLYPKKCWNKTNHL